MRCVGDRLVPAAFPLWACSKLLSHALHPDSDRARVGGCRNHQNENFGCNSVTTVDSSVMA